MPKNKFLSKRMCDIKSTCKETMNRKHRFVNPQESENHRY